MNFSQALSCIKDGHKVRRRLSSMYLIKSMAEEILEINSTKDGKLLGVIYVAYCDDLFAEDWEVVK